MYVNQTQTYQLHISACDKAIIELLIRITNKIKNCNTFKLRIPHGHGCLSLVSVVCCQVEVPATGTECGLSACDREALIMGRPWSTRGCFAAGAIHANGNLDLLH